MPAILPLGVLGSFLAVQRTGLTCILACLLVGPSGRRLSLRTPVRLSPFRLQLPCPAYWHPSSFSHLRLECVATAGEASTIWKQL